MYAYAEFWRYGKLPYAGGTFDQPAGLLAEMDVVHSIYVRDVEAQQKRDSGGKSRSRGGKR